MILGQRTRSSKMQLKKKILSIANSKILHAPVKIKDPIRATTKTQYEINKQTKQQQQERNQAYRIWRTEEKLPEGGRWCGGRKGEGSKSTPTSSHKTNHGDISTTQ